MTLRECARIHGVGRKIIQTDMMPKMKRFFAAVVAILCLALSFITCYASDLPEPTWVTINLQSDGSKTLTVTTPTHLIDIIEKYEYSFDSFETVRNMPNNGGEIVISSSCVFSLRYYSKGECSYALEHSPFE